MGEVSQLLNAWIPTTLHLPLGISSHLIIEIKTAQMIGLDYDLCGLLGVAPWIWSDDIGSGKFRMRAGASTTFLQNGYLVADTERHFYEEPSPFNISR